MSAVAWEIVAVLILIAVNGFLAMAEIAFVSVRKVRLRQRAESGDARAASALKLVEDPAKFLTTIQIGITLIGILAGAFGGVTIGEQLADYIRRVSFLAPIAPELGVGLVVIVITYLSLVLGELVPKHLALAHAERIAVAIASPIRALAGLSGPVERILSRSTSLVLRLIGVRSSAEPPVTEEEVRALIRQGARAGVFESHERDMIEGVFDLGNRRVPWLMTPRSEVVWLDVSDTAEEIVRKLAGCQYSRFPVSDGDLENLVGVVRARDVLLRSLRGEELELRSVARPAVVVPEGLPASKVLDLLRQSGRHMAIVVGEQGNVRGLVTLTDILEAIVGDLPAAGQPQIPAAVRRDDRSWILDGRIPMEDVWELLGHSAATAGTQPYHTLGGFVGAQLGAIPKPAQHFREGGFRFEVVSMNGRRVDKVLVTPAGA